MPTGLYLLISERVPDLPEDEAEHLLVEVTDDDGPPPDGEEAKDEEFVDADYSCVTTLVTNCPDNDDLRELVAGWWREMAGVDPVLELLADALPLMSADQRESLADLGPEAWSIRTPLVMYRKGSNDAAAEARRFVIECALASH